jgi:hypothetical protein
MEIRELIASIAEKHRATGIDLNPPASADQIRNFERRTGFLLPADFSEFYLVCNGFSCNEDLFNMIPLEDVLDDKTNFGKNWFYFSEYMVYSDMWALRLGTGGKHEIVNDAYPGLVLTSSLHEFLEHFLLGNVFDPGGLYEWQEKLNAK